LFDELRAASDCEAREKGNGKGNDKGNGEQWGAAAVSVSAQSGPQEQTQSQAQPQVQDQDQDQYSAVVEPHSELAASAVLVKFKQGIRLQPVAMVTVDVAGCDGGVCDVSWNMVPLVGVVGLTLTRHHW
jgi:hypothetical protein